MRKAITRFLKRLMTNRCPQCGMKIKYINRVGRCGYAQPCGCRVGTVS